MEHCGQRREYHNQPARSCFPPQGLAAASEYLDEWPLLIVVPSSMRYPWIEAIERWLACDVVRPGEINVVLNGSNSAICDDSSRITIVTYPLVNSAGIKAQIESRKFQVVIADGERRRTAWPPHTQPAAPANANKFTPFVVASPHRAAESHYLKNDKALRTQALVPVLKSAKRTILLSGTPALSRPMDLYTQLDALRPGTFGSRFDFGRRYCHGRKRPWGWDFSGGSNLEELHGRLNQGLLIRRLKARTISSTSRTALFPPPSAQPFPDRSANEPTALTALPICSRRFSQSSRPSAANACAWSCPPPPRRRWRQRRLSSRVFSSTRRRLRS